MPQRLNTLFPTASQVYESHSASYFELNYFEIVNLFLHYIEQICFTITIIVLLLRHPVSFNYLFYLLLLCSRPHVCHSQCGGQRTNLPRTCSGFTLLWQVLFPLSISPAHSLGLKVLVQIRQSNASETTNYCKIIKSLFILLKWREMKLRPWTDRTSPLLMTYSSAPLLFYNLLHHQHLLFSVTARFLSGDKGSPCGPT